jgi:hypothetical protein
MVTIAPESTTTDSYTAHRLVSDQRNPVTRRVAIDLSSELETREIEANADFYATIVRRIRNPGKTVDATEALGES